MADLAGSEKVNKTGATGDTLQEAMKINQSLSALGNCINALSTSLGARGKTVHVPYRDSKLTHLLKEALGGNSKTTLLIACSPHISNLDETLSTLRFGQRAKTIKTTVSAQVHRSVEELNAIIRQLQKEITSLRRYIQVLEKTLQSKDSSIDMQALKKRVRSPTLDGNASPLSPAETPEEQESASEDSEEEEGLSLAEMQVELDKVRSQAQDAEQLHQEKLQDLIEYAPSLLAFNLPA